MSELPHTLAIILGVSECPLAPSLEPIPQCRASALDFKAYLRENLGIAKKNLLDLFDSNLSSEDQLVSIEGWLSRQISRDNSAQSVSNLLIYYTGHGGFTRNDQSYFLATRRTRRDLEGATSIRYSDLAATIKRCASELRRYIILDCCFAAAAVIKTQSAGITDLVNQQIADALPTSGTAVLCSSAAKLVSIAPEGEEYTMFSGALLTCLRSGTLHGAQKMSISDVNDEVTRLINRKYTTEAVRPELHVPEQSSGDPSRVPLFPNALWSDSPKPTEEAKTPSLFIPPSLAGTTEADLAVGLVIAAASLLTGYYLPPPFGVQVNLGDDSQDFFYSGISVALSLSIGLCFLAFREGERRTLFYVQVPLVVYVAWIAAVNVAVKIGTMTDPFAKDYYIQFGLAVGGALGAAIVALWMHFAAGKKYPSGIRFFAISLVCLIGACSAIAFLAGLLLIDGDAGDGDSAGRPAFVFLLGLLVPWQAVFISGSRAIIGPDDYLRRDLLRWLASSAALAFVLIGVVSLPDIQEALQRLVGEVDRVAIDRNKATFRLDGNDVNLDLEFAAVPRVRRSMQCRVEAKAGDTIVRPTSAPEESQEISVFMQEADASVSFHVPKSSIKRLEDEDAYSVPVRLVCRGSNSRFETPGRWQDISFSNAQAVAPAPPSN